MKVRTVVLLCMSFISQISFAGTPGHFRCYTDGNDLHWEVNEVPVKLNWNTFYQNSAWIELAWKSQFEEAVEYAIRQWNAYSGASPWYYYAGTATYLDSQNGEVLIKMETTGNGHLADASAYYSCPTGQISRANISFRPVSGGGGDHLWNLGLGDNYTHFVEVMIHEFGHTYGLEHTCDCAGCELPDACGVDPFMFNQVMRNGASWTVDMKYQGAHGPWSWDAANVRQLRGQSSHQIAHHASFDSGLSWSLQDDSLNGEATNATVGVSGSNSNGKYVVAWQGTNGANSVNTIRGNGTIWDPSTKRTLSFGSQFGVSAAADSSGATTQKVIAAYVWSDIIGEEGAMDREIDVVYSSDQGSNWNYQYTNFQTVAKPGVAFARVSSSQKYWVIAYQRRFTRGIEVRVSSNSNLPPSWGPAVVLQNSGQVVGAYGGVQVSCAHLSNNCQVVFASDGTADAATDDSYWTFKTRVARGHVDTSGANPIFVVDGYEWDNGYHCVGHSIVQNYRTGWWHLGFTAPPPTLTKLIVSRKTLGGANWGNFVQVADSLRVDMGATAAYSSYWDPTHGELVMYVLRDNY